LVKQGGSIIKVVLKQSGEEEKEQDNGEIVSNIKINGNTKNHVFSTG